MESSSIGGFYGLIESILSLLPQDELYALFFDKLEHNRNFNNLITLLGSDGFQQKLNTLTVWILYDFTFFYFIRFACFLYNIGTCRQCCDSQVFSQTPLKFCPKNTK